MQNFALSSDGTKIGFTQLGDAAQKLVITPGGPVAGAEWSAVAHALESTCTSYLIDRRGRGASGDASAHNLTLECDDVLAVVSAVGQDAQLFGHSFGAVLALEAALRQPPPKLILYEPPLHAPSVAMSNTLQAFIDAGDPDEMLRHFFGQELQLPASALDVMQRSPEWARLVAMAPTFPREARALERDLGPPERYAVITSPTLLLVGERTTAAHKANTKTLATILPNASVSVLAGQGHSAHRTGSEGLARAIAAFLE